MGGRTFPEKIELTLLGLFGVSFVLIIQGYSQQLFQLGLAILIVSTLLEVAVGNIPSDAGVKRSLSLLVLFLAIIAAVFGLGIVLVPYLTGLGR